MMSDEPRISDKFNAGEPAGVDLYFIKSGEGSHHNLFPGVEIRTTAGDHIMLSIVHLATDSIVPEHAHTHEQMGMMIAGKLEFTIGGVTRIVEPGDIWRIPGNVPHKVRTLEGPAIALDVFHPVRDDYR
jgi:quercetin dioxygenase-like cupin family protein